VKNYSKPVSSLLKDFFAKKIKETFDHGLPQKDKKTLIQAKNINFAKSCQKEAAKKR